MRSKEVSEAIKRVDVLCEFGLSTILQKEQIKDIDTVLNYISELEKDTVSKSVIRDKIKELNEEFETNNSADIYGSDYYIASEKYAFCEENLKELLEGE